MRLIDADALAVNEQAKYEAVHKVRPMEVQTIMHRAIQGALAGAPTVQLPQWTSCYERLPDVDRFLYVSRFNRIVQLGIRRTFDEQWIVGGLNIKKDILFWMPLPEPPAEAERRSK